MQVSGGGCTRASGDKPLTFPMSTFLNDYMSAASAVDGVKRILATSIGPLEVFTVYGGDDDTMRQIFRAEARAIDSHPDVPVLFNLVPVGEYSEFEDFLSD